MNIDNLGQPAESSCSGRHIEHKDARRRRMPSPEDSPPASADVAHHSSSYENKIRSKKKRAIIREDGVTVGTIPRGGLRLEEEDLAPGSGVACRSYGKISVIGRRREMEDSVAAEAGFLERGGKGYDFFGVYDGHGGCRVAQACGQNLHKLLAGIIEEEYPSRDEEVDWEKVMMASFRKMDVEVNKNGAAVATTGSTAVVTVVGDDKLVVANCGDSRVVLSRGGAAIPLSDDHKPDRPDELKRIEVSGGKVLDLNGHRVLGVLATSRSIGDHYLKPYVATEPEVTVIERSHADEFLILASDGLWDVISNDLACQVARRCFEGHGRRSRRRRGIQESCSDPAKNVKKDHTAQAAALLAELAIARGSRDNISVVVVDLRGV